MLLSLKKDHVRIRYDIIEKYLETGVSKAEAERLMILDLFRNEVRHLLKKIDPERLKRAIDESLVEDVQHS